MLTCECGAKCYHQCIDDSPCSGEILVTEDYPGILTHFCEGHGYPEEWLF